MKILVKIVALAMFAATGSAQAVFLFHANLTGPQETPPTSSTAFATADFVLNEARTRLTYDVHVFGLDMRGIDPATGIVNVPIPGDANPLDNFTRMHIHNGPPGTAGGIVFGMIDLPINPQTINDVNPKDLVIDITGAHITGAWDLTEGAGAAGAPTIPLAQNTLQNQVNNLFAGQLYLNIHTTANPGGEIRGQILAIPEPGSLWLLVCALSGVYVVRRRLVNAVARP